MCLRKPAIAGGQAAEIARAERSADREARRPAHPHHVPEDHFRLGEPALVGEDLPDVVLLHSGPEGVAGEELRLLAGAVVLDRFVPAPFGVVVNAEVAQSGTANAVEA